MIDDREPVVNTIALPVSLFDLPASAVKVFGQLVLKAQGGRRIIGTRVSLSAWCHLSERSFRRQVNTLREAGLIQTREGEIFILDRPAKNGRSIFTIIRNKTEKKKSNKLGAAKNGRSSASDCTTEDDDMTDWKAEIDRTAKRQGEIAATAKRKRSARAERTRTRNKIASRQEQLDAKPVEEWGTADLVTYFHRKFYEAYPDAEKVDPATLSGQKGHGQFTHLRRFFTKDNMMPEDAVAAATVKVKALMDHTFDNLKRITEALNLSGVMSPGILLGFRQALLGDMQGHAPLKSDRAVSRDAMDEARAKGKGSGLKSRTEY